MRHVVEAGHRSGGRRGCMEGTRCGVLQQLEDWLHDDQAQRCLWLNGGRGSGESATAQKFAESCFADGVLSASFFCSRESDDRSDVQPIYPTLAFQLARRYPQFREELLKLLRANPDVGQESLWSQVEELIVSSFQATQIQTFIIIDALGRCGDRFADEFLLSLYKHMDGIPNVKFFVTGRPVGGMAYGFYASATTPCCKSGQAWGVEPSLVDDDIQLILRTQLREYAKTGGHGDFSKDWPGSYDIDSLCHEARGGFVCVSKFVEYLESQYEVNPKRLACWMSRIYQS